jgi:hypothetical protein
VVQTTFIISSLVVEDAILKFTIITLVGRRRVKLINKTKEIKEIISQLLKQKSVGYYSRQDIEKAIILSRNIIDKRAVNNWFNLLWKSELLLQPELGVYNLNVRKVAGLELDVPPQIDSKQRRLL